MTYVAVVGISAPEAVKSSSLWSQNNLGRLGSLGRNSVSWRWHSLGTNRVQDLIFCSKCVLRELVCEHVCVCMPMCWGGGH